MKCSIIAGWMKPSFLKLQPSIRSFNYTQQELRKRCSTTLKKQRWWKQLIICSTPYLPLDNLQFGTNQDQDFCWLWLAIWRNVAWKLRDWIDSMHQISEIWLCALPMECKFYDYVTWYLKILYLRTWTLQRCSVISPCWYMMLWESIIVLLAVVVVSVISSQSFPRQFPS